jgi:pectate lyase
VNVARRKTSIALPAVIVASACASVAFAIPAFPGADGFGMNAAGGRGGDVYHVTSLADTLTSGTLRFGLQSSQVPAAGRTIVFDVGGTINLTADLDVKNIHNVTIAGQTAPGNGVTLVNRKLQVTSSSGKSTNDIIVRYVAVRRGPNTGADDSIGVLGSGTANNIIIDHCSSSWALDENLSVTNNSTNVTISNCYINNALDSAGHAYGSLIRPQLDASVSYLHNLYADNRSRNPRPGTYNGSTLNFDFRNNVIYNWSDRAGYTGGASESDVENVNMNYMGNYAIAGPATPSGQRSNTAFTLDTSNDVINLHVYQNDNRIDSNHNAIRDGADTGWGMFITSNGTSTGAFPEASKQATPFAYPMAATDSPDVAYGKALASGGTSPWNRDFVDARVVNEVKTNTGTVITTVSATDWNNVVNAQTFTRPANFDGDHDGMPDQWEIARGLNPNVADNNGASSTGYSNLENYLNELTLVANWNVDGNTNWSNLLNWAGARPEVVGSTANFSAGITAPRTVAVDMPVTLSQLNFDSAVGYTLGNGSGTITMDAISGTAAIGVALGSHTVEATVFLARNTNLTVLAGSSITFTAPLTASGVNIVKDGGGAATLPHLRAAGVTISGGTVSVAANGTDAGASNLVSLSVASGAALDLNDNSMVVGPATPRATLQAQVVNARNGGAWDQSGITSSAARNQMNHATTLGLLSGAEYSSAGGTGTFAGQSYAADDSLIKYTWYGDSDFNGVVNFDDYVRTDNGFNNGLSGWLNGDFDLNGAVNFDDYVLIDLAFNTQNGTLGRALAFLDGSDRSSAGMTDPALLKVQQHFGQFGVSYARGLLASVPEPTSLVFAGVVTSVTMLSRRRLRTFSS